MRTQLWLLLYEAAESIAVLCSGRKGSCCWDPESHRSRLRGSSLPSEQCSLPRMQLRAHVRWESREEVAVLAQAPW